MNAITINGEEYIKKSKIAILVESPGSVWRLEESGIHNSLCMFGSYLSEKQRDILDKSGALVIIVLADPDAAGKLCVEQIRETCGMSYSIHAPFISNEDLGDTKISTIQTKLFPIIEEITRGIII